MYLDGITKGIAYNHLRSLFVCLNMYRMDAAHNGISRMQMIAIELHGAMSVAPMVIVKLKSARRDEELLMIIIIYAPSFRIAFLQDNAIART